MSYAVPVPAAGPSAQPLANPVTVVSPQFLAAYPVDLVITEKMMTIKEGAFTVSDVNGNLMFNIKGSLFSLHDRRVLVDNAGNPIVSFRQKVPYQLYHASFYNFLPFLQKNLKFNIFFPKVDGKNQLS